MIITAKIVGMTRLNNTNSGNPVYRVNTDQGSWETLKDGHIGYAIPNYEGQTVSLGIDDALGVIETVDAITA